MTPRAILRYNNVSPVAPRTMTIPVRRLLLTFALVGLASSLASLWVHARMLANPGYLSFCDVNATVSCTTVYQSAYSMFLNTPVALFGAGYFVVVVLLLVGASWDSGSLRENAPGYVFAFSTLGLGASLFLAYASFFIIRAVCVMCLVTYAAVIGLFLLSGARTPYPMTSLPRRAWSDIRTLFASPVGLTVLIAFILGATAALAFVPRHTPPAAPGAAAGAAAPQNPADRKAEFLKYWESQPRVQVPVAADGAAVLIVKFADYQCGACAQSHLDYKPILAAYSAKYAGAIRVVTKDFPLERECNTGMSRDLHYASCEAAAAVRLARQRSRGDAMEDWLYANSATLTPGSVRQAARDIGAIPDFDDQYASVLNQVKSDIALATILNVRVTPTFFINGLKLESWLPAEYFQMALDYELKKAGKIAP